MHQTTEERFKWGGRWKGTERARRACRPSGPRDVPSVCKVGMAGQLGREYRVGPKAPWKVTTGMKSGYPARGHSVPCRGDVTVSRVPQKAQAIHCAPAGSIGVSVTVPVMAT